jgi:hypothetical protein
MPPCLSGTLTFPSSTPLSCLSLSAHRDFHSDKYATTVAGDKPLGLVG